MEPEAIDENNMFGIDLVTTSMCVALATGEGIPVACSLGGKYTLAQVVTFTSDYVYVGRAAVQHEDLKRPKNTIRCVKRLMGRTVAELGETGEDKLFSYDYKTGKADSVVVSVIFLTRIDHQSLSFCPR